MRNIKELLQVMLDNKHNFHQGLCFWIIELRFASSVINTEEYKILSDYINNNRPHPLSSLKAFRSYGNGYYWKKGDIKPRIKWIEKHIKLNS